MEIFCFILLAPLVQFDDRSRPVIGFTVTANKENIETSMAEPYLRLVQT